MCDPCLCPVCRNITELRDMEPYFRSEDMDAVCNGKINPSWMCSNCFYERPDDWHKSVYVPPSKEKGITQYRIWNDDELS